MGEIILLLVVLAGIIALALIIQGAITMLASWVIVGWWPPLGQTIKANLLYSVTNVVAGLTVIEKWPLIAALGVSWWLLVPLGLFVFIVIPTWIFAHCLNVKLLQALAISVVVSAICLAIHIAAEMYLPASYLPKIHMLT